jgi:hypothetical protein
MRDGKPILVRLPELNFNDDKGGKPVGINQHIGRRPIAAFGNSDGDREMLEYTQGGSGARFMLLVLHDDAAREYAYGPARGLPDVKLRAFTPALDEDAKGNGWTVVSMKDDWKQIFPTQSPVTATDILLEPDAAMLEHESASIPKAVETAEGKGADAYGWGGRHERSLRGRLRERQPIQSGTCEAFCPRCDTRRSKSTILPRLVYSFL